MYTIDKAKARMALPVSVQGMFDDIVEQRILGASTHIRMIADMIDAMCEDVAKNDQSVMELIERIEEVCNYFIHTRGEASQAITNAIYSMTKNLYQHRTYDKRTAINNIRSIKDQYQITSKEATKKAVEFAIEIGNRCKSILVYDYSSSVEAFLNGLHDKKMIYIAESRVINGGKPFVQACLKRGHDIHFIPDASLMYYMKDCEAVFMGAETILPDGTGFNTTGSDIVGVLCEYYKIPLYFISPLIKIDTRVVQGKEKQLVINDLSDKMNPIANPEGMSGVIDYHTPELVPVAPKFIHAFICEQGVIPSYAMYDVCMKYMEELKGE